MNRRLPGQSIRDRKDVLTENWLIPFYFAPASMWLLWLWEWQKARTHQPPHPQLVLFLAVALTGVAIIIFGRLYGQYQNLNKGERGELKVAEVLDELRGGGYRIIHDIVRPKFNVDHVVVGPSGVYAIETKFRSGKGEISFRNGKGLFVGGVREEGDSLKQARGNAREVNRLIEESCGAWHWVTPLVVFVGDWRVKDDWRETDARVFTPNGLARYIIAQQPRLKRSEIALIASHLERSVKT